MTLTNAVALVTGASSGLGQEISVQLIEAGVQVFGLARSTERLQALHDTYGDAFIPCTADVRDQDAIDAVFETIQEEAGRLDILINNAGLGRFGPIDEMAVEDWDVQHDTNLRGLYLCTRAAVPMMRAQNEDKGFGGHIVNIASIAGLIGNPNISAYNASKFGVRGFSQALMKEVRGAGIRVSCLYPGSIETDFFERAGADMTDNPLRAEDVAATAMHVLKAPENHLISEVVVRPLRPRNDM
ncbi:NAD-binding protein [Longimonas halophila]|uniref:NAD-binding protein n=1 Tax=Longimonas halophila TaxID=1469170 RepID=A0A2H3NP08_9BACT|nr:SDR family oxidoreductase [Longimonas halophila]PEN08485.1 NAD-binding protein [Longimonas halophila]